MAKHVRIALTISGAVSLGAYEGGALAALITAMQAIFEKHPDDPPVRLDAIGGASAGSITGLLTARCLLAGLDPVNTMYQSWVKDPSLTNLRGTDNHSPLNIAQARDSAAKLLNPGTKFHDRPKQPEPIEVWMALASLRGLNFRFGRLSGGPIEASTYLDFWRGTFPPSDDLTPYINPKGDAALDFALASGANALGFPPYGLDRKNDEPTYVNNDVTNFPKTGWLWYTDGGTINNEPLGQTLTLINDVDDKEPMGDEDERIMLLIHPHPDSPVGSEVESWSNPKIQPAWLRTLIRSFQIQTTQSIFTDLRHVEKTNSRIVWTKELTDLLVEIIPESREIQERLQAYIAGFDAQKAAIDANSPDAYSARPEEGGPVMEGSVPDLLRAAVKRATGFTSKSRIRLEVISPWILPQAKDPATGNLRPASGLLAGEFLHHFGGFVDEAFRVNDFALGYQSMRTWLESPEGLDRFELTPEAHRSALGALRAAQGDWPTDWGHASMKDLPPETARADRRAYRRLKRQFYRVFVHEGIWHQVLGQNRRIFNP